MITVCRRFEFDFAHKLPNYQGKCSNLHGHRGILEVEVNHQIRPGVKKFLADENIDIDYNQNFVLDFGVLKKIIQIIILDKFDHAYLNDCLGDSIPTAENIVYFIWDKLGFTIGFDGLVRIRFYETPDSYAEIRSV